MFYIAIDIQLPGPSLLLYGRLNLALDSLTMRILYHVTILSLCLLALPTILLAHSLSRQRSYVLVSTLKNRPLAEKLDDSMVLKLCAAVKGTSNNTTSYTIASEQPQFSLEAFSATNQRLDHVLTPEKLRIIKVGKGWGWAQALRALDAIALCEALDEHTREFMIDLSIGPTWVESFQEGYDYKGPTPPSRFPQKFLEVLTSLTNLEKLTLIIPEYHTEIFRTTFQKANTSFPSVRTLVLGPHMDWVIAMCPNVERISTHDWRWLHSNVDGQYSHQHSTDLINSAGQATNLRHFDMSEWWTLAQLENVHHAMPGISSLAMTGGMYNDRLEVLLPMLSRFQNLTSLVLAPAFNLHVGFDPPMCGNAFDGPDGEAYLQQVIEEGKEADEKVVRMVYGMLPRLEKLWVGDHFKASLSRSKSAEDDKIS